MCTALHTKPLSVSGRAHQVGLEVWWEWIPFMKAAGKEEGAWNHEEEKQVLVWEKFKEYIYSIFTVGIIIFCVW